MVYIFFGQKIGGGRMKINLGHTDNGNTKVTLGKMTIRAVLLSEMLPAEYNPRTIGNEARQGLKNSIKTFGLVQPIIFNQRTKNIVGGHQRYFELLNQKVIETDCVIVDLSLSQEKKLNVSLNNKFIQGDFISEDLNKLLEEIKTDFDFKDLGLEKLISDVDTNSSGMIPDKEIKDKAKDSFANKFCVIVECSDENEQAETFDKLQNELGFKCRLFSA